MKIDDLLVVVRNRDLTYVGVIDHVFLPGAIFSPRSMDVGTWQVELPETVAGRSHPMVTALREPGAGIMVWSYAVQLPVISGPVVDAVRRNDTGGGATWQFSGVSDMTILDGALMYPSPNIADPTAQSPNPPRYDLDAKDVWRLVVNQQIGASAPPERRLGVRSRFVSNGATPVNMPNGPRVTVTFERFETLLSALKRYASAVREADGSEFYFTVSPTNRNGANAVTAPGTLYLLRKWSTKHPEIVFDLEQETLSQEETTVSAPSVTQVIAAAASAVVAAENTALAAEWGFPRESYVDSGSATTVADLETTALAELTAGAAQASFSITPRTDVSDRFPSILGDIVTVIIAGTARDARINGYTIAVTAEGVVTDVQLGNLDGTDWEGSVSTQIASLSDRVGAMERGNATMNGGRLGGSIGSGYTDLNELTQTGWYQVGSDTASNRPPEARGLGSLEVEVVGLASSSAFQTARTHGSVGDPYRWEWVRDYRGPTNGWSAWRIVNSPRVAFSPKISSGGVLGNGSLAGVYQVSGGSAKVEITFTAGSTSGITGDLIFESPLRISTNALQHTSGGGRITGANYQLTTLCVNQLLYVRCLQLYSSTSINIVQSSLLDIASTFVAGRVIQAVFDLTL